MSKINIKDLLKDLETAYSFIAEADKEQTDLKKLHKKANLLKKKLEKKYLKNLDSEK